MMTTTRISFFSALCLGVGVAAGQQQVPTKRPYVSLQQYCATDVVLRVPETPDEERRQDEGQQPAEPGKGSVEDLVVSARDGQIVAAVLSVGDLITTDEEVEEEALVDEHERLVLVSIEALEYEGRGSAAVLRLSLTEAGLADLPEFDLEAARAGKQPEVLSSGRMLTTALCKAQLAGADGTFGSVWDAAVDLDRNRLSYVLVEHGAAGAKTTYIVPIAATQASKLLTEPVLTTKKTLAQLESGVVHVEPVDKSAEEPFLTKTAAKRADEFFGTPSPKLGRYGSEARRLAVCSHVSPCEGIRA